MCSERQDHYAYSACGNSNFNLLRSCVCRSDDDGQMLCDRAVLFELSYLLGAVNSIEHGHLPIHQDNVQPLARSLSTFPISGRLEIIERFATMIRNKDLMTFSSKLLAQHFGIDFVVLDQ